MKLSKLFENIEYKSIRKNSSAGFNAEIENIQYDSRLTDEKSLFVCIKGYETDGHKYAESAYKKGCRAFLVTDEGVALPDDATIIAVENTRRTLALCAAKFYGEPAKKLTTVALTGTKGKTSTSFMLKSILEKAGHKVGVIGTIGIFYDNIAIPSDNSTPESLEIHKHFAKMLELGCDTVIIEATSQGFMLDRTYGILFDIGVFLNLSPDHIGGSEHPTFENYVECKTMLFKQCRLGIVNADDKYSDIMKSNASCKFQSFGINTLSDFNGTMPEFNVINNRFFTCFYCKTELSMHKIEVSIPGFFTVYNALAAIACAVNLGVSYEDICTGLRLAAIRGRMEVLPETDGITVLIDYAHNELSMKSLYETVNLYEHGKIITVFGCGGGRSVLRRTSMGKISGENSDLSILTSDNPRFEEVDDIIKDIITGIEPTGSKYIIIPDRKEAIFTALDRAEKGDVVLIVGKGHQEYEEIKGVKYSFDERGIVSEYFAGK